MFYLATKQRSDLFLVSGTILFLCFIFTTSVLPPQNIDALNVNQNNKKNQLVSVKCHTSIAATTIVVETRPTMLTQYFSII